MTTTDPEEIKQEEPEVPEVDPEVDAQETSWQARGKRLLGELAGPAVLALFSLTVAMIVVYYFNDVAPQAAPTPDRGTWFYGLAHGVLFIPTLVATLFSENLAVSQTPHDGFGYSVGFFIGFVAMATLIIRRIVRRHCHVHVVPMPIPLPIQFPDDPRSAASGKEEASD